MVHVTCANRFSILVLRARSLDPRPAAEGGLGSRLYSYSIALFVQARGVHVRRYNIAVYTYTAALGMGRFLHVHGPCYSISIYRISHILCITFQETKICACGSIVDRLWGDISMCGDKNPKNRQYTRCKTTKTGSARSTKV